MCRAYFRLFFNVQSLAVPQAALAVSMNDHWTDKHPKYRKANNEGLKRFLEAKKKNVATEADDRHILRLISKE